MAPAFRQATLWGVVLGAIAAVVVVTFSILWDRRSRELKLLRAQLDQLQKRGATGPPRTDRRTEGLTGPDPSCSGLSDLLGLKVEQIRQTRAASDGVGVGA